MAKESREIARTEPSAMPSIWNMEKWFEDFFRRPFPSLAVPRPRMAELEEFAPTVDVFEEGNEVVVKAELPGMKKEDIDITLTEDSITLSGEKKKETEEKKRDYYRWECSYGSFRRTFSLPANVQKDKVKADFKDGVLEIRMPKTEEAVKSEVKVKIS